MKNRVGLSRSAILSAMAFGIIAIYYGRGNPTFAQGQTQQQQNQPAPIIARITSEPMQDTVFLALQLLVYFSR